MFRSHCGPASLRLSALLTLFLSGSAAAAPVMNDPNTPKPVVSLTSDDDGPWTWDARYGATLSFNYASDIVGVEDGASVTLGLVFGGYVRYLDAKYEWLTTLDLQHAQSLTPAVDGFIKSVDDLDLATEYRIILSGIDWLGPAIRFRLNAPMLPGSSVVLDDTEVQRIATDGTVRTEQLRAQDRVYLTGAFEPLILTETIGVSAIPIDTKDVAVRMLFGPAGRHVIVTDEGYALADDGSTAALELRQLQTEHAFGAHFLVQGSGLLTEYVDWQAKIDLFVPIASSLPTGRTGFDGMNAELLGGVAIHLGHFATLNYSLGAVRIPVISDEWQIRSALLLTTGCL